METMLQMAPKAPVQSKTIELEYKQQPPIQQMDGKDQIQNPYNEVRKPVTPDRLRVAKALKYPERYTSPTNTMISPVTKGLLARSRKCGALLPPGKCLAKIPDLHAQDMGLLQNKEQMLTDEKLGASD